MRQLSTPIILAIACAAFASTPAQGGQGGMQQELYDRSTRAIDAAIATYLDGEPIRNILTPGQYSEWPLTLKDGQVVIAEAWSEAFDPALEVADEKETVLATNDDRYPGDQRPLLLWRCETAGSYRLRARCFLDKAGGQFFLRFKIYDSIDLGANRTTDRDFEKSAKFLLRVPMKAGEIKQVFTEVPDNRRFVHASIGSTISPVGLPDIGLAQPLRPAITDTVMAPVDGVFYVVASVNVGSNRTLRAGTRDIPSLELMRQNAAVKVQATTNTPSLWKLAVKAGEILEIATPELHLGAALVVTEEPDISAYDMTKSETNPFFPQKKSDEPDKGPAFVTLPGRARDSRVFVFAAKRDATLWIASNGAGERDKQFTLAVDPAPKDFAVGNGNAGKLRIGKTDYWTFDAKVGDVMTFDARAAGFTGQIVVRDPDLTPIWNAQAEPDQTDFDWDLIVSKPGKYLVAVSCMGDGGGGDYALARNAFYPKDFAKGSPAQGELADGDVHVWRFTARPEEPLLVRWTSPSWSYSIVIRDDQGRPTGLPQTQVDGSNRYGILKVDRPTTYLVVLMSNGEKTGYKIELADLPGLSR